MYKTEGRIRDVFEYNMNEEIKKISLLIQDFNYVSMVIDINFRILNFQE